MMQYSLLDRRPEETCLPLLQENNIGVMARGAVAKGLLVDKSLREYLGYSEQEVARLQVAVYKLLGFGYGVREQARKDLRAGKSDTDVREVGGSHRKESNAKRRRKATK
jgi:aryl-alcohol dehydrogenase-like predicted oxidoreductase